MSVVGYWADMDPVCGNCAPEDVPDDWIAIFSDSEADTPAHCMLCKDLIDHALTEDGIAYIAEAIDKGRGDPEVLAMWADAYGY